MYGALDEGRAERIIGGRSASLSRVSGPGPAGVERTLASTGGFMVITTVYPRIKIERPSRTKKTYHLSVRVFAAKGELFTIAAYRRIIGGHAGRGTTVR